MKLFDYQLEAVEKMHNGCILCANVGRGKSITALGYYWLRNRGGYGYLTGEKISKMSAPKDLYIITTAAKRNKLEWDAEVIKFGMSTDGDSLYNHKVVVDSWNNIKKYETITNAFFIFDEQKVVGSGVWARSFIKIAKSNEWILLTATPGDTWGDYRAVFIANGFYKNYEDFNNQHVVWKPFVPYRDVQRYVNEGRLIRLRDRITVDMRGQNPAVQHHEDVIVDYDVDKYRYVVKNRWNPFTEAPIASASEYCQCLRKIVNSHNSRQLALLELVESNPTAIIFYNYDFELDILRSLFEPINGLTMAEWNGHKHEEIPRTHKWVYLVQYNAGCEGWNCITTNCIIFYSKNYSYKMMIQAAGRIDRLNTAFPDLYYYYLKSRSGIDMAIDRALRNKKKFVEGKFYNPEPRK